MDLFTPAESYLFSGQTGTLAEHLGYSADTVLVIINADDLGLTRSVNNSIATLFAGGQVSSSTLMATGGEYRHALGLVRDGQVRDCGLHLTLTSSLPDALARPILPQSEVRSIVDADGRLFLDREDFFRAARPHDAEKEASAQIEKALADGVDLTHLDSHEGTLQLRPEFATVYIRLGARYRLPMRMGSRVILKHLGYSEDWLLRARQSGLHFPDNFVYIPIDAFSSQEEKAAYIMALIDNLPGGVTELYFHPAQRTALETQDRFDLNAEANHIWRVRSWDYDILASFEFRNRLNQRGARLISFRPLRELVRS